MATPMISPILMHEDATKKVDSNIAPPAGTEVRRSMLQIARTSLLEAPRPSKMSIHAHQKDIESELEKSDGVDSNDEGEGDGETQNKELSPPKEQTNLLPKGEKFNPIYKLHLIGSFKGLLNRLFVLMQLPRAFEIAESHIDLKQIPEEKKNLAEKNKHLGAANLIAYALPHPIKISKFEKEAKWLQDVLEKALHEVVELDIAREKRLTGAIESVKDLKYETEVARHYMKMEAEMHLEKKHEWATNLIKHKKELRDMQNEQRRQYEYKAELALAAGDLARRDREIKLRELKGSLDILKPNMEREKLVHKAVMEYMNKQNLLLREEIVNLNDALTNDNQCMDWAIERIELQIKMNKLQINDLQPKYDAEMEANAKAEAEAKRREEEWYANLGFSELSLKSAYKIQKIWRGYLVRRIYGKVLRKLRKKRLAAKKKKK